MCIRDRVYSVRKEMDNHKIFLRFSDVAVNFLTNEFLLENYEIRGGALSPRKKMEISTDTLSSLNDIFKLTHQKN